MEQKKILITGGTGFIGNYLCDELMQNGHLLTIITRSPDKYSEIDAKNYHFIGWDSDLADVMNEMDVVINLAGENLFGQRWSDDVKKRIYNSRIETTRKLTDAMKSCQTPPELFISASAVGIYGDQKNNVLNENSPAGSDFLASVCTDWEKEAEKISTSGIRLAIPRIGIVLEEDGGVIEKMKLPFLLFGGGPLGSGEQFVPWIHMNDLIRGILHPVYHKSFEGAYNVCSPNPETMNTLAQKIGSVLNRPSFFRVPEFALNLVLGEAAEPILASLRVEPARLLSSDFEFYYEDLETALADIL